MTEFPPILTTCRRNASGLWVATARNKNVPAQHTSIEMADPVEATQHVLGVLMSGYAEDAERPREAD